jgi:pre-mRNA-processing factor 40
MQAPIKTLRGQTAADWVENRMPDGSIMWHNVVTKQSVRDMPPEVKAAKAQTEQRTQESWQAVHTADGRTYYWNTVTDETTWTIPESLRRSQQPPTSVPLPAAQAISSSSTVPRNDWDRGRDRDHDRDRDRDRERDRERDRDREPSRDGNDRPKKTGKETDRSKSAKGARGLVFDMDPAMRADVEALRTQYPTPVQRVAVFKQLLSEFSISVDAKLAKVFSRIRHDPRFFVPVSLAERKHAFREYCVQKSKQDKLELALSTKEHREAFFQMLAECSQLSASMSFARAASILQSDDRFHAVEGESRRRALYETFMAELERKEAESRRKAKSAFAQLLEENRSHIENSRMPFVRLLPHISEDPRFKAVEDDDMRTGIYRDLVTKLRREEEEIAQKEVRERKAREKEMRDAFKALVQQSCEQGEVNLRTSYATFEAAQVAKGERLMVTIWDQPVHPRELFEDVLEDCEKQYQLHKNVMRTVLEKAGFTILPTSSWSEFEQAHSAALDQCTIPRWIARLVFLEFVAKEADRVRKEAKANLADMLASITQITSLSKIDDFAASLQECAGWKELSDDDRRSVWNQHVSRLAERSHSPSAPPPGVMKSLKRSEPESQAEEPQQAPQELPASTVESLHSEADADTMQATDAKKSRLE